MIINKNRISFAIFLSIAYSMQAMDTAEENLIITIVSDVIDSAIPIIADEIQILQTHIVSQHDAVAMLQSCANSLVDGSKFELNGTTYTVQA